MNISAILGFGICVAVLASSAIEAKGARDVLLNHHAIVIVIGGTLAATFVSFPFRNVFRLTWLAFKKLLGVESINYSQIIQEVLQISETVQKDPNALKNIVPTVKNPFLKEGLDLIVQGATEEQLSDIMGARIETFRRRHLGEANMFRTIGKFPPAFGLLGTTFGMISLLNQLGAADAQKMIGPAMAIGLVATLYGISLTNFLFVPIAENLSSLNIEDYAARKMVLDALILMKRKTHPVLIEEKMKSYLLPSERSKLKKSA
jgi:chemotaxis protein MotA